ncbi:Gfo/Idh/MocA family protein [Paenibacillus allorhizosphaerae]|uniref:Scyllo-inositol 2-dehydrogenase (NAD(+)) n=1 Tax=Paenibacillus allorhizosphaerae TaxID=2849866 RepID=A0ABM8VB79_9BACL|nr:Gfo/Idh/MocA family oxidoreductase [Paenibacillus allorhizosphaerae]CAG7618730.1 scyllo-inositol 2-dehydrogenase (NAD(+)) [Paenibacillus allorhizosphaerae]
MAGNNKIRFAIVGCGAISSAHFTGIERAEEAELVAVCDADPNRAEQHAQRYNVRKYTDYGKLLADPDVDVVCLATPSGVHPQQTIMAAQAGKHIVCEKPIAIRLDDVERMISACAEAGVQLATIFPRRVSPAAIYVKRLLDDGKLGKLSLCSGYVKFYRSQAYYDSAGWRGTWAMDGGGAMMNQGIHTIDLLQWLAGPVRSLFGYARPVLRNIEVEDTAVVSLQFQSGALGSIEATTTAHKQPDHRIIIHGDRGTVELTGDEVTALAIDGEQLELPQFAPFQVVPDGHAVLIRDMALAIRDRRRPMITGEDGRHALEIILGTYESERSGQPVRF